ncbi:MAG TPA: hypothetical protein O0Y08_04500 [Methanocorpusculum sp.]|nr:hypothetical protein [Methanocorpusculum sp.]HJJ60101.1 hypothetical protein [Methanocorpusculum sp.]
MTKELTADEMDKLYVVSRLVFKKEIEPEKAAEKLAGLIPFSVEQNMVTFAMYVKMRQGHTFQQSVSDDIIVYFLFRIAEDEGKEGLELALSATYGYAGFKNSVGSALPELENACDALKMKYGLDKEQGE